MSSYRRLELVCDYCNKSASKRMAFEEDTTDQEQAINDGYSAKGWLKIVVPGQRPYHACPGCAPKNRGVDNERM